MKRDWNEIRAALGTEITLDVIRYGFPSIIKMIEG